MVMGELPVEAEVVVIGGGPGGYAAAFRAADLGLDVTLVTDEPQLGGVCLLRGCIPSKTLEKSKVRVSVEGEADLSDAVFDRVLVAIGRRPNSDELGLEAAKVRMTERGYIVVDEQRRTTNEQIFAVGDVAGGMLLAHEAMQEGKVAAEVIAGQLAAFDGRAIPAVVYTDPQVAWCGLTEQEANAQKRNISVARFPWNASGRAVSMGVTDGFTKVVMDQESQQVLGVGMVGRHADALIAEGVLAVEMGAVAEDLALTIHPHPTLAETLGEAAEMLLGSTTHVFRRREKKEE